MDGTLVDIKLVISIKNHFIVLQSLLYLFIILIILLVCLNFNVGILIASIIIFGLDVLTSIYLHVSYMRINKSEEYVIKNNLLIRKKRGEETIYRSKDIEKIIVFLSPALYKNSNMFFLAIEGYHYTVVKLKSGEELVLTCLLAPRIDQSLKQLKGVFFEKRKKLFCKV